MTSIHHILNIDKLMTKRVTITFKLTGNKRMLIRMTALRAMCWVINHVIGVSIDVDSGVNLQAPGNE